MLLPQHKLRELWSSNKSSLLTSFRQVLTRAPFAVQSIVVTWFGARSGTAYAGIRTPEATYRLGAKLLAEGLAIRATERILEVDEDTGRSVGAALGSTWPVSDGLFLSQLAHH